MAEYNVELETTAVLDLQGILNYITNILKQPETAERIFFSIEEKVISLGKFPKRYKIVRDEPYAGAGVRLMPIENYTAFYIVDDAKHEVHVLRILYNRRQWQNLL